MPESDLDRLRALGAKLRRIRVAENPGPDGAKEVWHVAGEGIDLVTHVTPEGRAERQELGFDRFLVVWKRSGEVRTARQSGTRAGDGRASSGVVSYHDRPVTAVLERAQALLQGGPQGDRYIDHLAQCLAVALAEAPKPPDTVTNNRKVVIGDPVTRPRTAPTPAPEPPPSIGMRLLRAIGLGEKAKRR